MIYKCKGCGSALRFDLQTQKLFCDYCGESYSPEDYKEVLKDEKTYEQKIYRCSACGAQLMINDVEAASFCAYCGQPTVVFDRISAVEKPDVILPFKISKEDAHALINKRLKRFFVPKEFKDITLDVVRGIYVPFSFSDVRYAAKAVIRGRVRNGKNSVTKYFFRETKGKFEKLAIDRSLKFNDFSARRLEPFPVDEFKPFEASYLSGFYADCGDEKKDDIVSKVAERSEEIFNDLILETVRASDKEIESSNRAYKVDKIEYGMLPVWFFAYTKNGLTYTIMVNGYTGKVVGAVPIDKLKTVICSALIGIPLCAVLGAVIGALGWTLDYNHEIGEDGVKIALMIFGGIAALFGAAIKRLKAFWLSRNLTMENSIFEIAKKRTEV